MNGTKHTYNEALDIGVYDVYKCFDSLWLSECINNLYESGLKNDKLVLLHEANLNANIAIKTWDNRKNTHIKCCHARYSLGWFDVHKHHG